MIKDKCTNVLISSPLQRVCISMVFSRCLRIYQRGRRRIQSFTRFVWPIDRASGRQGAVQRPVGCCVIRAHGVLRHHPARSHRESLL